MRKVELQKQLNEVIVRMHSSPQRIGLLKSISASSKDTSVDSQLEDAMSYLGICVSYLLFDNDCLQREIIKLRAKGDSN